MDDLRKKTAYRCRRRGTYEADLLFGAFADLYLHTLDNQSLKALGDLLNHSDADITDWLHNRTEPPMMIDKDLLQKIRQFAYSMPFMGCD